MKFLALSVPSITKSIISKKFHKWFHWNFIWKLRNYGKPGYLVAFIQNSLPIAWNPWRICIGWFIVWTSLSNKTNNIVIRHALWKDKVEKVLRTILMVKDSHRNKELGAGLMDWRGGAGIREREREWERERERERELLKVKNTIYYEVWYYVEVSTLWETESNFDSNYLISRNLSQTILILSCKFNFLIEKSRWNILKKIREGERWTN